MATRKPFTRDEIVLCIYAARYDIADIGGIETIHALQSRSPSPCSCIARPMRAINSPFAHSSGK
jgi:hypothetical protein